MATKVKRIKGYVDGLEYGRKMAARITPSRRADNERFVRDSLRTSGSSSPYYRAYWLGFVRAMREGS